MNHVDAKSMTELENEFTVSESGAAEMVHLNHNLVENTNDVVNEAAILEPTTSELTNFRSPRIKQNLLVPTNHVISESGDTQTGAINLNSSFLGIEGQDIQALVLNEVLDFEPAFSGFVSEESAFLNQVASGHENNDQLVPEPLATDLITEAIDPQPLFSESDGQTPANIFPIEPTLVHTASPTQSIPISIDYSSVISEFVVPEYAEAQVITPEDIVTDIPVSEFAVHISESSDQHDLSHSGSDRDLVPSLAERPSEQQSLQVSGNIFQGDESSQEPTSTPNPFL